jgi:hypothetical protein
VTDRKLFGTDTLINAFVQKLTKVESLDGGWSTKYIDKETGFYWLKYIDDDRSSSENLMFISPPPTTHDLIQIALTSKYPDEVSAAAARLSIEEQFDEKEFRQMLMDRLNNVDTARLDKTERDRIKTIIEASKLTGRVNKREILGKHFSEIEKDAAFFNSIADNAANILSRL